MNAKRVVLILGPGLLALTRILPPPSGMGVDAWAVTGVAAWMALWWLSAVVPLEATALIPIVLLPLLGDRTVGDVTAAYADPIIFLFLGGFFLAATLERWDLHKRFALNTVRIAGTEASRVVLAFMLASAALSMWISNTATAVMMLPIGKAVADAVAESDGDGANKGFGVALMLGIAYACSIGGASTLIGTPPNALLAGNARELLGIDIGFGRWMIVGLSVAVPMLFMCWFLVTRMHGVRGHLEGLDTVMEREAETLHPMSGAERYILGVFTATALAWIFRAPKTIGGLSIPGLSDLLPGLSDAGIAIGAAVLLFVVPLPRSRHAVALNWESARAVPWGILLLFGGGLALAAAFADSGLTEWVGGRLQALEGAPTVVIFAATATLFVLLTEMTSNTATAALGMPLIAGVAVALGLAPLPLMATAALAASMAFMLPVATPPNAIVFGSGLFRPADMARAGLGMNALAIIVITLVVTVWAA